MHGSWLWVEVVVCHLPCQSELQQLLPVTRALTSTCHCPSISTQRYWLPLWGAGKAMALQTYSVCLTGHQFGWKGDQAPTRWSLIRPLTKIYSRELFGFWKICFWPKYGYGNVGGLHIWTHIDALIQWEMRAFSTRYQLIIEEAFSGWTQHCRKDWKSHTFLLWCCSNLPNGIHPNSDHRQFPSSLLVFWRHP